MKHLTKEWYATMQKTGCHLLLETSNEANTFSEDFYQRLYKQKELQFVEQQKHISEISIETILPETFTFQPLDPTVVITEEEYEKERVRYSAIRAEAIKNYVPKIFDLEKEKESFAYTQAFKIKDLQEKLTPEILSKVADIRILALDTSTAAVKNKIAAYCKHNLKTSTKTLKDYYRYHAGFLKAHPLQQFERFTFHDCTLVSIEKQGADIEILFDNSGGFTGAEKILFKNAALLKQDGSLTSAIWLYEEIYEKDNRFEFHALLSTRGVLADLIIEADSLVIS